MFDFLPPPVSFVLPDGVTRWWKLAKAMASRLELVVESPYLGGVSCGVTRKAMESPGRQFDKSAVIRLQESEPSTNTSTNTSTGSTGTTPENGCEEAESALVIGAQENCLRGTGTT